jgi:hypothetical protein
VEASSAASVAKSCKKIVIVEAYERVTEKHVSVQFYSFKLCSLLIYFFEGKITETAWKTS